MKWHHRFMPILNLIKFWNLRQKFCPIRRKTRCFAVSRKIFLVFLVEPYGKLFDHILKYFQEVNLNILNPKNITSFFPDFFLVHLESFRLFPSTNGRVPNSSRPRIVVAPNVPEFHSSRDYYSSKYGRSPDCTESWFPLIEFSHVSYFSVFFRENLVVTSYT